jgi:hypothetical protein
MQTIRWVGTLTAVSSIAHAGETRGTVTLLRREKLNTAHGMVDVPVVSGNTLRGRLRRLGEELFRDAVGYEGQLHPAAAHALRGGGSLAKTGHEPLSGSRLQRLRELVPQIGVFGAAGGGTIIDGALSVGKVVPELAETVAITGVASRLSAFRATQLEPYTRQDDTGGHGFADVLTEDLPAGPVADSNQMLFQIETFPAGTVFHTWLTLHRPTPLEASFFLDVLRAYRADGRLGGRVAIGHGRVQVDLVADRDLEAEGLADWRADASARRGEILDALSGLA